LGNWLLVDWLLENWLLVIGYWLLEKWLLENWRIGYWLIRELVAGLEDNSLIHFSKIQLSKVY
jgi:hypothetical protein